MVCNKIDIARPKVESLIEESKLDRPNLSDYVNFIFFVRVPHSSHFYFLPIYITNDIKFTMAGHSFIGTMCLKNIVFRC